MPLDPSADEPVLRPTTSRSPSTGVSPDGTAVERLVHGGHRARRRRSSPSSTATAADDTTVRKIPGLNKHGNITLKRGITGHVALLELDPARPCNGRGPARQRLDHAARREPPRGHALELHQRLADQVHRAEPERQRTTRSRMETLELAVETDDLWTPPDMAATAALPGSRVELVRPPAEPSPLRTDVAGVIGRTRRGPVGEPVRVDGWRDLLVALRRPRRPLRHRVRPARLLRERRRGRPPWCAWVAPTGTPPTATWTIGDVARRRLHAARATASRRPARGRGPTTPG